jgi:protocatechuate 3,4-dioxygenase beta subunit
VTVRVRRSSLDLCGHGTFTLFTGIGGAALVVRGRVLDTGVAPIAGATADAWQTNEDGFYNVQQKGVQPDMNLRGVFMTDVAGAYWFRTAKPRYYPFHLTGRWAN